MRGLGRCLLVLVWATALPAVAETLRGVVIGVIDGDTVLFKPDHSGAASRAFLKVRLADIDAPEKDQPYGEAATRALTALVRDQHVEIHTVATDAYGRSIAHLQKGAMPINTELVRLGFAWTYDSTRTSVRSGSEYPQGASRSFRASRRYRRNASLMEAQNTARRAQRGLWADASPTPPWMWRRAPPASAR